jgi:predicted transcriptional regulator
MSLEQFKTLLELLKGVKKIVIQEKKRKATQKANEARSKKAKKKIKNAINILRLENEKINYTSIAKKAKVSFVTVKKYIDEDTLKSLNESN